MLNDYQRKRRWQLIQFVQIKYFVISLKKSAEPSSKNSLSYQFQALTHSFFLGLLISWNVNYYHLTYCLENKFLFNCFINIFDNLLRQDMAVNLKFHQYLSREILHLIYFFRNLLIKRNILMFLIHKIECVTRRLINISRDIFKQKRANCIIY